MLHYRSTVRLALGALLMASMMIQPTTALGHDTSSRDGEVIADGSGVVGNVHIETDGRVGLAFQNNGNCPAYISNCYVEVRFVSKCDEPWCATFDDRSGWIRVPQGADHVSWCGANDYQQWYVDMRIGWQAQTTKTVRTSGESESVLSVGGGYDFFLLPKFLANLTNNTGWSHGTTIETVTATQDYSPHTKAGSSGSEWLRPSC